MLVRVMPDSAGVGIGRTLRLRALPLDDTGALLPALPVQWTSQDGTIATVDSAGLVTGVATGRVQLTAEVAGQTATAILDVDEAAEIVLSSGSVSFTAEAGDADPGPDSVQVTNGGVFPLVGLAVDSIVYGEGAADWLAATLGAATAPTTLRLAPTSSAVTASGTYTADVWLSGTDADNSPTAVGAELVITGGAPMTAEIDEGDGQTAAAGTAVAISPSVRVSDAFDNPVPGIDVTFAITEGGGSLTGAAATTDDAGIARVGSWTLGTAAGPNALSATPDGLAPIEFTATGAPGAAAALEVSAGDEQSAVAGNAVAVAPAVVARDGFGNPVPDVPIAFEIESGGGSLTGATTTTGADGIAVVGSWTLGATLGTNTLFATSTAVTDTATFTATVVSSAATAIQLDAGDAQTDTVAATLAVAYSVRVVDGSGNGVAGVPVGWSVTGGGGSIPASTTTDASGFATAVRVLGTRAGTQTAQAAIAGLAGSPVEFTATAQAGTPAEIGLAAGGGQSATVNTPVSSPPSVVVRDGFDNPIAGHSVTFAVTAGGGSVAPTTAITTGANGRATVTSWTLGTVAGSGNNTLTATAAGAGIASNPLDITASATAGPPTSIQVSSGSNQTAVAGASVSSSPTVIVRDAFDNPVANVDVMFAASGGGSVGTPSATTNASGNASTTWTVEATGHTVGTNGTFENTLTASAGALSTAFTGFARYSFATHVNVLFTNCTGCHGGATPFSGLALDRTAAQNHASLVGVGTVCDPTQTAAGYFRVASGGGVAAAETFSIILRLLDASLGTVGACAHPFTVGNPSFLATINAWIRNGAPNN